MYWRILYNKELHDLHSSFHVRIIKITRMGLARHEALVGK
jgi:hypothetical protein